MHRCQEFLHFSRTLKQWRAASSASRANELTSQKLRDLEARVSQPECGARSREARAQTAKYNYKRGYSTYSADYNIHAHKGLETFVPNGKVFESRRTLYKLASE